MQNQNPINIGEMLVLLDRSSNRKHCGQVVAKGNGGITIETVDAIGNTEELDFSIGTNLRVLANLGEIAPTGTVYGCQVRKLYSNANHEFWGRVSIMRVLSDDEKEALKSAMLASYKTIKHIGLSNVINLDNFIVSEAKGKWAGMYKSDKKGNHIFLHPKDISKSTSKYIVDHELAHAIWFQTISDIKQAKWVQLYTKFTKRVATPDETLSEVIDIVSESAQYLDDYRELVSEIEYGVEWFYNLVGALLGMHLFHVRDLNLYLWSISNKKRRAELERAALNLRHLYGEHKDHPISEYGSTNVGEMFAEAYAFYVNGMPMHEDVVELLEETIPQIRNYKG